MSQQYYNEYNSGTILSQQYLGRSIDATRTLLKDNSAAKLLTSYGWQPLLAQNSDLSHL